MDKTPKDYDSPENWMKNAAEIYRLILKELDYASNDELLYQIYPKLITCYEFFRLLRGESFHTSRPPGTSSKELYRMEDDIKNKLIEISRKINPDDEKVKFYLEEAKNSFWQFFEKNK